MTRPTSEDSRLERSHRNRSYRRIRLGKWRRVGSSLEAFMEACSVRVGSKFYAIGGYQTLTQMCQKMQICDLESCEWSNGPELPQGFPLSHAGIASDGRFLFVVTGQPGPACEPATDKAWRLDLERMIWEPMPPLPVVRFAPLLEYVDGNLHLISGATEDRETISDDHFILPVRDSEADFSSVPSLETQVWRKAPPIPLGGDHAASVVLDGKIYVIGGEHGHAPVTMDASKCCGTYYVHDYLFRYEPKSAKWTRLANMPFGSSHIESQIVTVDHRIIVLGGTGDRDVLMDRVQEYDPAGNCWRQVCRLPIPRKGGVMWEREGFLYSSGGQIGLNGHDRQILSETVAARIKRNSWLDLFRSKAAL